MGLSPPLHKDRSITWHDLQDAERTIEHNYHHSVNGNITPFIPVLVQMRTWSNTVNKQNIPTEEAVILKKMMVSSGGKKSLKVWTGGIEGQCPRMQGEVINVENRPEWEWRQVAMATWGKIAGEFAWGKGWWEQCVSWHIAAERAGNLPQQRWMQIGSSDPSRRNGHVDWNQ